MLEREQSVGVRDAIITAFWDVFCRDGSRDAEISEVVALAGVSESAFYEQFQSKEDLVSAFLKNRHAIWMRWFENEIEARYETTRGGLEIITDVLQEGFEDPKCFDPALINILTEGGDFGNELFTIVREQKEDPRRFIEQLAAKMDLQHPDMAASAAVLVIERTIVRTRDWKPEGGFDCAATLSVSSARLTRSDTVRIARSDCLRALRT